MPYSAITRKAFSVTDGTNTDILYTDTETEKILENTALNKMFPLNFPAQTSGNPAKEEEEEVGERQQQAEGVGETE